LFGFPVVEFARKNAPQTPRDDAPADGVSVIGLELKEARESLGITIADMAAALRIRAAHIEALEDGRFSDLPGRPYTLGFARSMARHLGLDADAVSMRLRDEVSGVARPVELVFPESTEDKRLSRTGWIVISLALVALAYSGWLALAPRDDQGPPEFAAASSAPTALPESLPVSPDPTDSVEVEDQTPETTVGVAPVPEESAPLPAPSVATAPPVAAPRATPTPPPAVAVTPVKPTTPLAPSGRPGSPPAATPAPAANAPPAATAPAADDEEEDVTPEPSSVAAALPVGRVVIRARQDSWVQIQAASGVTVMARTLRAGETYTVPDQSGLRLTTGNAGALEVIVDGQTAPALGQIGAVRRNVNLDPVRLKAGAALE
jgi:cytoskeleton protein RodZ